MPTVLELYEKLKPKLGDEETRALLEFLDTSIESRAATKQDLQQSESTLRQEIQRTESALRQDIQRTESALREEMFALREEIHNVKVDLIKWSFGFWIGSIAVLSGIIFALLRAFMA